MSVNNAAKNVGLDAIGNLIRFISLHTDTPDASGSNEVTGGSPAYRRLAITWSAASGAVLSDSTNGAVFDVPAGTTVRHVGYWSAVSAGTYYGADTVTNESFTGQGQYRADDVTISS